MKLTVKTFRKIFSMKLTAKKIRILLNEIDCKKISKFFWSILSEIRRKWQNTTEKTHQDPKFFKWSKMVLPFIKLFFRIQKIHPKPFFIIFHTILDQKIVPQKKSCLNFFKIVKNRYFWKFKFWFAAAIGRKSANLWSEGQFSPKVFPKFFLSQLDKNSLRYLKNLTPPKKGLFFFWGGGGTKFVVVSSSSSWYLFFHPFSSFPHPILNLLHSAFGLALLGIDYL